MDSACLDLGFYSLLFIISGAAIAEPGSFTFDINDSQEPYQQHHRINLLCSQG